MTAPVIPQLEAAAEGSRGLDETVAFALGWTVDPDGVWRHPGNYKVAVHPFYTQSVDAALTLILDGMWFKLGKGRLRRDEPLYGAILFKPNRSGLGGKKIAEADARTMPLAIVIAALRARGIA